MYYIDVQDRKLTSNLGQYKHFREENDEIVEYLGLFPRVPENLDVKTLDRWDFDDFTLKKISYKVEPEVEIRAYLLIPKGAKSERPGILAFHQHNDEYRAGKSETVGLVKNPEYTKLEAVAPDSEYQPPESRRQFAYAKDLAKRGFVVLAPDFISFEEYRDEDEYYEQDKFLRLYEQTLSEKYILYGSCLLAKHVHDAYIATSVLSSLENVDSNAIGVIGHSLGGNIATMSSLFDKRIKAGVSNCGIVSYEDFEESRRAETADTILPGFRKNGKDYDFFLDKIPPTHFLATVGKEDMRSGTKKVLQGDRNNFEKIIFDAGHEFPKGVREEAYSFLDEKLK